MKKVHDLLTQKTITLFELKHPSIIQCVTNGNSLGYSLLPPIVANRLNIYAEQEKSVFYGRDLKFIFFSTPIQCNDKKYLDWVINSLIWQATGPTSPFVWVMAPRLIISLILGNMQDTDVGFYYPSAPSVDLKLYELYKSTNSYQAALFSEKHLQENLN